MPTASGATKEYGQRVTTWGQLLVFRSRRGDRVKLLWWDGDGWAQWSKRPEVGRFSFPSAGEGQASATISTADFAMLLEGIDLASVRRVRRYKRPA